jgi:hypothetical protein
MKKKLLLMCSMLITTLSFGQVIFSVESPASIGGSKDMTYAPTTTWTNTPDLTDPANAVLGTLAFAKDASTGDSLNCMQTVTNVTGKVAVLYRGSCEFGTKALNAEQAGAIAVVIINNQAGGPVGMGAGADGPSVTIPVVMIGDLDGAIIVNEMANGPVDVFIGNKSGFYANDLGLKAGNVVRAQHYATPQLLAQNDTEFDIQTGAYVYNFGFNNQTNVTLNATVTLNGTTLYDETSSAFSLLAQDSVFVGLPVFNEPTYAQGNYEMVYTITSDSTDNYAGDNSVNADFQITDRIISYASLDANGLPNNSGGFRPSTGADFTACMAYRNDNASRMGVEGMYFTAITGASSGAVLTGEPFIVSAFQWDDQFTDLNDANAGVNSYSQVAFTEYIFEGDYQDSSVFAKFDDAFVMLDNQRYLFCVYTGNSDVFIGYDPNVDYTTNIEDVYLQPQAPNLSSQWFLAGFGFEETPAFALKTFPADELGLDLMEEDINVTAFPSPANTNLTVSFNDNEVSTITMVDMTGKTVKDIAVSTQAENTVINVQDLENGVYMLNVSLANGAKKIINVVVNH